MKALAAHILAPKESRDTMSGLGALIGGFMGAKLQSGIGNSNWMAVLTGEVQPPMKVAQVARAILNLKDSPEMIDGVLSYALDWIEAQGHPKEMVLKALRDYSSVFGVQLTNPDVQSLRDAALTISQKIVDADDAIPTVHAIVDCPQCRYVFTV